MSLDGKSYTSQLIFEQALVDEIFAEHADYEPYGAWQNATLRLRSVEGARHPGLMH